MKRLLPWAALAALAALPAARAAEWSAEGNVRATMDYNENLLLEPDETEQTQGGTMELRAQLARRTENGELALAPRARFLRYDTEIDNDSDDQFLDAWYDFRGERVRARLSAGWARDSTLTSELEDTGLVDARKRHEQLAGNGTVSFEITLRDQVGAQVALQDNSYVAAALTGLVDYEYANAFAWYSRGLTEQSRLGIQVAHGELDAPLTGTRSEDESIRLTFDHAFERHLTLALSAGVSRTDTNGSAEDGTVFAVQLNRVGELNDWGVSARQEVAPSGNGRLVRRHQLTATLAHRFAARFTLHAGLRYVMNEELESFGTQDDREYQRADLRVDWRAAERWTIGAGVGYAWQRFAATDRDARGAIGSVFVAWAPLRAAISR